MRKWSPVAVLLVGLYVLCLVVIVQLAYRYMHTPSSASGPSADRMAVEQCEGFPVYPGARRMGYSGGTGSSGNDETIYFSVLAPYAKVVQFYTDMYRSANPTVRAANTGLAQETMLIWQDDQAGYAVLIRRGGTSFRMLPTFPSTSFELVRISMARPAVAATQPFSEARQPVEPEKLGFSVYPGATVDYSGWLHGEPGKVAFARLQVNASGTKVADFYRDVAKQHESSGGGYSKVGFETTRFSNSWKAEDDQFAVAMLHLSSGLPTVVWLRRGEVEAPRAAGRSSN